MAWQRRNGRLIRGNDTTLVALPQRTTRRRRARPKPNRLKALPAEVAAQVFDFLSPCEAIRVAATASDAVGIVRPSPAMVRPARFWHGLALALALTRPWRSPWPWPWSC